MKMLKPIYMLNFLLILCLLLLFNNSNLRETFANMGQNKQCVFEFVHLYFNNTNNKWYIYVKDTHSKTHETVFNTKEEALHRWNSLVKLQENLLKDCVLLTVNKPPHVCIFDYVHYYEKNGKHTIEVKETKTGLIKTTDFVSKQQAMSEWRAVLDKQHNMAKDCILIDLTHNKADPTCVLEYAHLYEHNGGYVINLKNKLDKEPTKHHFNTMEMAQEYWKEINKNKNCHLTNNIKHHITNLNHSGHIGHKDENKCVLEYAKLYNKGNNYVLELKKFGKVMTHEFHTYEQAKKMWDFLIMSHEYKNCKLKETVENNEFIHINKELNKINDKLLKQDTLAKQDKHKLDLLLNKFTEHSKYINEQYVKLLSYINQTNNLKNATVQKQHEKGPQNVYSNLLIKPRNYTDSTTNLKHNIELKEQKLMDLDKKLAHYRKDNNNNKAILEDIYGKLLAKSNKKNKNITKKISKCLKESECPKCPPQPLYAITTPVSVMEIQNQRVGSIVPLAK